MAQAVGDQAIALGTVTEHVRALKQTLARQFPDLAEELKGQMEAEQEKSRKDVYELQVSLAKVREAIALLPEAKVEEAKVAGEKVERKRRPSMQSTQSTQTKARTGARKAGARR
jgi:hypothetical protein